MSRAPVYLVGTGSYLPGKPIGFREAQKALGDLPEAPSAIRRWFSRTTPIMEELLNIRAYHYAFDPVTRAYTDDGVSMAVRAARTALDHAGVKPSEVDLICYGSAHQDQMPTASVRIQEMLGIDRCEELSIHANCTSAYKALHAAAELLASGRNRTALALSSNVSSSELRSEYFNQGKLDKESLFLRWFLCDGAGAALLSTRNDLRRSHRLAYTFTESLGCSKPSLMFNYRPAYWMNPQDEYDAAAHHLRQRFANALSSGAFQEPGGSVFVKGLRRMLTAGAIPVESIRFFQVNLPARHIAESVVDECAALGIPRSAFYSRIHETGYTGPPMALMCLDQIARNETLDPGGFIVSFVTEVSKFMQAGYAVIGE